MTISFLVKMLLLLTEIFFLTIYGSTLYSPKKKTLVSLPTVSLNSSFLIWKATFASAFLLNLCYFKNYLLVMAAPTSIIFFSDSCSVLSTAYIPSLRHFFLPSMAYLAKNTSSCPLSVFSDCNGFATTFLYRTTTWWIKQIKKL